MGSGALHAADVNLDSFALKDAAVSVSFQIIPRVVGQRYELVSFQSFALRMFVCHGC